MGKFTLLLASIFFITRTYAQEVQRCATVERLQRKFEHNRNFQLRFEQRRTEFNKSVKSDYFINRHDNLRVDGEVYSIPVVVHVVLPDPSIVSDEHIMAQLDTLNKAFAGSGGDAARIPSYFVNAAGSSIIQFCLAQRTPEGLPTTGIHRVTTSRSNFSATNENVKYTVSGGTDSWNSNSYMNIWITSLSGGILGYSSFPEDDELAEQGVVIDYRSLPGGSFSQYDNGKTLVHETGHFFNLYHIWGDDNGACSGTDYVDDTPPQANSTSECTSGKKFDRCTSGGNGIMYQNYMDYTQDECLVMFTSEQVTRMETAITTYFGGLLASNACQQVSLNTNDASIVSLNGPGQRLCSGVFTPSITIKNEGLDTLKSLQIALELSNGESQSLSWKGILPFNATEQVSLSDVVIPEGNYTMSFSISLPNESSDEDASNDTLSSSFQYYPASNSLSEGFEGALFPPKAWDQLADNQEIHWEQNIERSLQGSASATLSSSTETNTSLLRMPEIYLQAVDSAWLSFAYASADNSLELLVSKDCGQTYTSLYKAKATGNEAWVRDFVELTSFIDQGNILLVWKGTTSVSATYLDDINLRKVIVNPILKSTGFLVTPNPASSTISVQLYPQPSNLKSIEIFTITGQLMIRKVIGSLQASAYNIDISALAAGVYVVSVKFTNSSVQKKIIKSR